MRRRLLVLVLLPALVLLGCGDADDEVGAGSGGPDSGGGGAPAATFEGTITQVTPFEPTTEGCTPPGDLDPDGAVSSDDPPVCTDPTTAPLGSILVEADPDSDGGDKIVFTVGQHTVLTRAGEPIAFGDLTPGAGATVGFDGQVAESFPGQARAEVVTLRA